MGRERDDEDDDSGDRGCGLTTARLVMRKARAGDRVALEKIAADPRLGDVRPGHDDGASGDLAYVIVEHGTGIVIGEAACCGLSDRPAPVELRLWLDPACWGKGYGTEATHALIDRAFADGRVGVLWSSIRVANAGARRVLEKSGFQYRGAGMQAGATGGSFPVERFMLDRRNWASLKAWGAETVPRQRGAA